MSKYLLVPLQNDLFLYNVKVIESLQDVWCLRQQVLELVTDELIQSTQQILLSLGTTVGKLNTCMSRCSYSSTVLQLNVFHAGNQTTTPH